MWLNCFKKEKKIIYHLDENDWTALCSEIFMLMFMKILKIKDSRNPKVPCHHIVSGTLCTFYQIGELYVNAMLNLARQVYQRNSLNLGAMVGRSRRRDMIYPVPCHHIVSATFIWHLRYSTHLHFVHARCGTDTRARQQRSTVRRGARRYADCRTTRSKKRLSSSKKGPRNFL